MRNVLVVSVFCFALFGCTNRAVLRIGGSSSLFQLVEFLADSFQVANPNAAKPVISVSGTTNGFEQLLQGQILICHASRRITPKELALFEAKGIDLVEQIVSKDGIALVAHPNNQWLNDLTLEELQRIWSKTDKLTYWNEVRSEWPQITIRLFAPGLKSGTRDHFEIALFNETKTLRQDIFSSESDHFILTGIHDEPSGLGFVGYPYYLGVKERCKLVGLKHFDPNGLPIISFPNVGSIDNGEYPYLSRTHYFYYDRATLKEPYYADWLHFCSSVVPGVGPKIGYSTYNE